MAETESRATESLSAKWPAIILTGVVSLIAGVVSALALDYIRTSSAKLEYEITSSSAFSGQTQKIGMLAVDIRNGGRKELEQVTAQIRVPGVTILEAKVENLPIARLTETTKDDTYNVEIPFLNPSEWGRIVVLFNLKGDEVPSPSIELRSRGLNGIESTSDRPERMSKTQQIIVPIAAGAMSLIAFIGAFSLSPLRREVRERRERFRNLHGDKQNDVTAFALDANGLVAEAHVLRFSPRDVTYWSIADELTQSALTRKDPEHIRRLIRALEFLLTYARISGQSCLIIQYNLARLYNSLGDDAAAKKALASALVGNTAFINQRIAITDDFKGTLLDGLVKPTE